MKLLKSYFKRMAKWGSHNVSNVQGGFEQVVGERNDAGGERWKGE